MLDVLNSQSGLLGLSGVEQRHADARARKPAAGRRRRSSPIDVFCYRAAKAVGALAVALGGLDAVVFTGGIGEKSVEVRARCSAQLGVLGLAVDDAANAAHGEQTRRAGERGRAPVAMVVPTDEELVIARDTARLAT